jgi:predicted nucleotidyltransferase
MNTKRKPEIDATTADAARRFIGRLAGDERIVGAFLFGSRARNAFRLDSDADIAVLLRGAHGRRTDEAMRFADIAFDVMLETGVLVEALPLWEDEWADPASFSNPALIENIRREGIRL